MCDDYLKKKKFFYFVFVFEILIYSDFLGINLVGLEVELCMNNRGRGLYFICGKVKECFSFFYIILVVVKEEKIMFLFLNIIFDCRLGLS